PAEDQTPHRLQAAAAQTINELAQARKERSLSMPISTPSGGSTSPPMKPPSGQFATGPMSGATPMPQTTMRGRTVQGAVAGAGVVLLLVLLAGGAFFFINNKNNNDATATAQVMAALQTGTRVAVMETEFAARTETQAVTPPATATATTKPTEPP